MTPSDTQLIAKATARPVASGIERSLHSPHAPLPFHCPHPPRHALMLFAIPQVLYTLGSEAIITQFTFPSVATVIISVFSNLRKLNMNPWLSTLAGTPGVQRDFPRGFSRSSTRASASLLEGCSDGKPCPVFALATQTLLS